MTTSITSVTPINYSTREVEVVTADPVEKYRREEKNGFIAWFHWNGTSYDYMTTGWRSLEALFQGRGG